jgi:hypothetical protein
MVRMTTKPDAAHEPNSDRWNVHTTLAFVPISDAERASRKALMERMLARRNEQEPLDIPSDQLVRESRVEAYGADER